MNYIAVIGCLLRYGMSMGKVTKAFSYSFNVSHVSPSFVEGGTGKISDWITEAEYFKWVLFVLISNACVKSNFSFGKTTFHKVLKLAEGAIKLLQHNIVLYIVNLRKIPLKEVIGINFNIWSCKPKVCSVFFYRCL